MVPIIRLLRLPSYLRHTSGMIAKRDRGKAWSTFLSQDRFHGNVVLNFMKFPKGELSAYARSYHEAGQHLAARMSASYYRDPDACPIVFLYRHAVELYLKSIIHWGNSLLTLNNKTIVAHKNIFTEHRLRVLLKSVKPALEFVIRDGWDDPHFKSFKAVEKIILELDEFDPRSYAFRYPIDSTGKKASLPHHFCFNVLAFGEKFDHLMNILDGISMMLYEDFQSQAEAFHEMQQMNQ
jgi:hypothetical protein